MVDIATVDDPTAFYRREYDAALRLAIALVERAS
jgi:hypothetical protein